MNRVDPENAPPQKTRNSKRVSYEDTEGLLTTLGIIAALVLSFMVGLFVTVPMEEMTLGDYRTELIVNRGNDAGNGFRRGVLNILEEQKFNFTKTGNVDVKEVLEYTGGFPDGSFDPMLWKIDAVFHLTHGIEEVMDFSSSYCAVNHAGRSQMILLQGGLSTALIAVVFFADLCLYVALAMSSAREAAIDDDFEPLRRFNRIGIPFLGVMYFVLMIGTVVFFIAMCNIVALRAPAMVSFSIWRNAYMIGLMISLSIVSVGVSAFAWWHTEKPDKTD
jgi:hypothetical protein